MIYILNLLGGFLLFMLAVFILAGLNLLLLYTVFIFTHPCPHCGKTAQYKGREKMEDTNCVLFYCPHCKKWEILPIKEVLDSFEYMVTK